jgi:hypothetical protein
MLTLLHGRFLLLFHSFLRPRAPLGLQHPFLYFLYVYIHKCTCISHALRRRPAGGGLLRAALGPRRPLRRRPQGVRLSGPPPRGSSARLFPVRRRRRCERARPSSSAARRRFGGDTGAAVRLCKGKSPWAAGGRVFGPRPERESRERDRERQLFLPAVKGSRNVRRCWDSNGWVCSPAP